MALPNPSGLRLDFLLKTFGFRFLTGMFLLLATYGFFTLRHLQKSGKRKIAHHNQTQTLHQQLRIKKIQQADDQKMVALLVAYLEKFHTTSGAHSFTSLLTGAKFSDNEIVLLQEVNYGKRKLSNELKMKILQQVEK